MASAVDEINIESYFDRGQRFENENRLDEALIEGYLPGAREGNVPCMYRAGLILKVQRVYGEAESWFKRAAEEGNHADSMYEIGRMLRDEKITPHKKSWFDFSDEDETYEGATYWFERAKQKGSADACYAVAEQQISEYDSRASLLSGCNRGSIPCINKIIPFLLDDPASRRIGVHTLQALVNVSPLRYVGRYEDPEHREARISMSLRLAECYKNGIGVIQDTQLAEHFMAQAEEIARSELL